jgi:hypothetical protein
MILYVNGDSHSAGHGTQNPAGMCYNDVRYKEFGDAPHPDNLPHSYGYLIAKDLDLDLVCQAESGSSVERSIRLTKQFIYQTNRQVFVLIGFPSIEREEWQYQGNWYQINASGSHGLPETLQTKYKNWVAEYNNNIWHRRALALHNVIYNFHHWLLNNNIPHLFFNTEQDFSANQEKYDFGHNYIGPYEHDFIYSKWLKNRDYVPDSWSHFGIDAHRAWADFLKPHINDLICKWR